MFAGNYLIGLREGLEASLVVCILVAYLVKTDRRDALPPVWLGVGIAVALSVAFQAALQLTENELTFEATELLGGTLSIVAVGLVTWMIFWMRRTARHLKAELQGKLDSALELGRGALILVAFLAVGREGMETSLFLWSNARDSDSAQPLTAALFGIATAVVMGWLFYRGALRINLSRFFTWTGAMLVVVAAGVLAYGVHDLQEADFVPGLGDKAFTIDAFDSGSWYGTLLKGIFNFQPDPTWLQVAVWSLYLVPTMYLFLRPYKTPAAAPAPVAPTEAAAASKSE